MCKISVNGFFFHTKFSIDLDPNAHTQVSATAQTLSRSESARTHFLCWFGSWMSCGKYLSRGLSFASVSQAHEELTPPFLFLCLPVWWNWQRTYWNSWWTWCSHWCAMASSALPVFSEKTSWTKWSRRSYYATLTLLSRWPREASLPGTTQALWLHIFKQSFSTVVGKIWCLKFHNHLGCLIPSGPVS